TVARMKVVRKRVSRSRVTQTDD
ncbi:MAG: hypothetical protein RIQ68_1199, partial [Pseudomonadota bacterium]